MLVDSSLHPLAGATQRLRGMRVLAMAVVLWCATACRDYGKISAQYAAENVAFLAQAIATDVGEIRTGLPAGADVLAAQWKQDPNLDKDPKLAKEALESTRRK